MKLYSNPASPFARKCRVIIHELEIRCEIVDVNARDDEALRLFNPLKKIPILVRDDGSALYDSPVICEYLDSIGGPAFFPKAGLLHDSKERWRALTLQALADGMMDAAVAGRYEVIQPKENQNADFIARYLATIDAGLLALENTALAAEPTIGELSTGCMLGYLDFRYADLSWRTGHPTLATWFETFARRPSMTVTAPPPAA